MGTDHATDALEVAIGEDPEQNLLSPTIISLVQNTFGPQPLAPSQCCTPVFDLELCQLFFDVLGGTFDPVNPRFQFVLPVLVHVWFRNLVLASGILRVLGIIRYPASPMPSYGA